MRHITYKQVWFSLCVCRRSSDSPLLMQQRTACQGPCGRLCIPRVPGSDQARGKPGHVWVGSPRCQPAVQELQGPGPHHWHRIPSVHTMTTLAFPYFSFDLISVNPHVLLRLSYQLISESLTSVPLFIQCKTQMRKPCRGRGKEELLLLTPHFSISEHVFMLKHFGIYVHYPKTDTTQVWTLIRSCFRKQRVAIHCYLATKTSSGCRDHNESIRWLSYYNKVHKGRRLQPWWWTFKLN